MFRSEFKILNKSDDFIKPSEDYVAAFKGILPKKCFKAGMVFVLVIHKVSVAHSYLIEISE